MKIAYLTSQYPATSHTFIRREVEALRRRGVEVATFSIRPPTDAEAGAESDAFRTTSYVLPWQLGRVLRTHARGLLRRPRRYFETAAAAFKDRVPGARSLAYTLFYFAEAIVLADELERQGVAHVHNHFANPSANVGLLATRFLDLGWSMTLHGLSDFDYPSRLLLPHKVKHARFVVCVSHYGRAQAFRLVDVADWDKVLVVRCGVEPAKYPPRKAQKAGRKRVLSVGRLAPEKGQLGLIDAFANVLKRGIDAELCIIGDGPLKETLERRVAEHGIAQRVLLLGRKTEAEVAEELANADVFAMSSFMEGLPVVLMEALTLGLGVIAPCLAGIPELVTHEGSGLLFAPGNWAELEGCLIRLLTDPELALRLGRAGQRRVQSEFDVDVAIEPLLDRLNLTHGGVQS